MMISSRLTRLRNQLLNAQPRVCAERALLVTQAYEETPGGVPAVQRARAMEKILLNGSEAPVA